MARCLGAWVVVSGLLFAAGARAQVALPNSAPVAQPEIPEDRLGRGTPRGTVRGLLTASSKDDEETAVKYLNTRKRGEDAVNLAQQLAFVLNQRLPARLNQISDKPEGSFAFPNEPDKDLVGTISSDSGDTDIIVERVRRKGAAPVWLFSQKTLQTIPELYEELEIETTASGPIKFLLETRIAHIALIHWLTLFVGLPLLHFVGARLNRLLSHFLTALLLYLRKKPGFATLEPLPTPVRLLLLAFLIRWALSEITLPLLAREFWYGIAVLAAVVGVVWFLVRLTNWFEGKVRLRLGRRGDFAGALSVLRFVRSAVDSLIIFVGLLVLLYYFGFNPTTVLAGLGVGGIAVALAAQKTLENVIAGISLISDKAIRVGDFLKIGDTLGTVNDIGLRSTRIRTLDRTVVNVPNSQIANASLENISLRDRFWFHPMLRLTYETTAAQLRSIIAGITNLLAQQSKVEQSSLRVRLVAFGESSLDLEIFAYLDAGDYATFLRYQEDLLLQLMDLVEAAGARIAVPARAMYLNAPLQVEASPEPRIRKPASQDRAPQPT
jgi:MscS family membrane protein